MKKETITIELFNPFDLIPKYTGRRVINRDQILLIKALRLDYEIKFSGHGWIWYEFKKAGEFGEILNAAKPVLTSQVAIGMYSAAGVSTIKKIYKTIKKWLEKTDTDPKKIEQILYVTNEGTFLWNGGNSIKMSDFKREYWNPPKVSSISPNNFPVYWEHTPKIVGWYETLKKRGDALGLSNMLITDSDVSKLHSNRQLGLSMRGLAKRMTCTTCNRATIFCNHNHTTNVGGPIDIIEISFTRNPIAYYTMGAFEK